MNIKPLINRVLPQPMQALFGITLLVSASITFAAGAKIEQATAEGQTRADACKTATDRAAAGMFSFLESQGRIQKEEKKCECAQDKDGHWSCMASVSYVEKD